MTEFGTLQEEAEAHLLRIISYKSRKKTQETDSAP